MDLEPSMHTEPGSQVQANYAAASHAVVLRTELRGFSSSVQQSSRQKLLPLLDEYVDFVSTVSRDNGGEVYGVDSESVTVGFGLRAVNSNGGAAAAVRAAQQLLEGFETVSGRWRERAAAQVALSIGLHEGEVIEVSPGSNRTPTLAADAVDVATRLAQRARAGEAILSAQVRQSLHNQLPDLQIRPLGGLTFADRTRRVDIYCIPRAERLDLGQTRHLRARH
jgi:class 3 adenylate cyclase